jgi:hypothetical protein
MSRADHPVGPVEMMLIGLPDNRLDGAILPALSHLVDAGTLRLIDMVVVSKDLDGRVTATAIEGGLDALDDPVAGGELVSEEDVEIAGEQLAPNSSAALVLWEDSWAVRLSSEIFDAGGAVLLHDRVPAETVAAAFGAPVTA